LSENEGREGREEDESCETDPKDTEACTRTYREDKREKECVEESRME
jgi:hypothetical protein